MRTRVLWTVAFMFQFVLANSTVAQPNQAHNGSSENSSLDTRSLRAVNLVGPAPDIDGVLDESVWTALSDSLFFVQLTPQPGAVSSQPTGVQVVYDQSAVYVGIRLFGGSPTTRLTRRDVWSEAAGLGSRVHR